MKEKLPTYFINEVNLLIGSRSAVKNIDEIIEILRKEKRYDISDKLRDVRNDLQKKIDDLI